MNTQSPARVRNHAAVGAQLAHLLADTYALYLKTHVFHWNVTGPHFASLHALFEAQYGALALAVDEVAERLRALDLYAPGSYRQFAELTSIREETGVPAWRDMLAQLAEGHATAAATAQATLRAAEAGGDDGTADLATARLKEHQKTAWMLRAHLQ